MSQITPPSSLNDMTFKLKIGSQTAINKSLRKKLAAVDTSDFDGSLRFTCRVAQDMNKTLEEQLPDGWTPNRSARAQFGKDFEGKPYLTVGVVDNNNEAWRIRWTGKAIPRKLAEVAVKHDTGSAVRATVVPMPVTSAQVIKVKRDQRVNHDTDKTGRQYSRRPRRTHNRICAADLKAIFETPPQ